MIRTLRTRYYGVLRTAATGVEDYTLPFITVRHPNPKETPIFVATQPWADIAPSRRLHRLLLTIRTVIYQRSHDPKLLVLPALWYMSQLTHLNW